MEPRIEFKPPSDFVPEGSGSGGGRKIWKILGIGCAVIVVLIGIALALGAWKTVSCCGDMVGVVRVATKASTFGLTTARELQENQLDAVHAKMSETLARQISVEELDIQRREYARYFDAAEPRVIGMSTQSSDQWDVSVEFATPTGARKLVVRLGVRNMTPEETEEPEFALTSLILEQRDRDLSAEPPARAVLDFHLALRRGNDEDAYERMEPSFGDISTFRTFLSEQKPVFRTGTAKIISVRYEGDEGAQVEARIEGDGPEDVLVSYRLVSAAGRAMPYSISEIKPTYQKANPVDAPPAADDSADQAKDSDDGAANAPDPSATDEDKAE